MDRRRYLAVEVFCEEQLIDERMAFNAIRETFAKLFGLVALSSANLKLVSIREWPYSNVFVISCSHRCVDRVRASIALIDRVDGIRCSLRVVRVSGTIRALKKRLIESQAGFELGMRAPSQSDR